MTTFPQTATLGHSSFVPHQPAKPLPKLHAIPRSLRKRNTGGATALHTIACNDEEFLAVCEFLAERRIGGVKPADKRPALPRHKAK